MTKNLQLTSRVEDQVMLITLKGDLTQTQTELTKLLTSSARALILDFSEVAYINSAGIAQLIILVRQAKDNKLPFLAYGVSEHYQKIFHMVGLSAYLYLYPDEGSALAAVGLSATP